MGQKVVFRYSTLRLNTMNENSWAIIEEPPGSIALSPSGKMLTRLSKDEASTLATQMNAQLHIMSVRPALTMWPSTAAIC